MNSNSQGDILIVDDQIVNLNLLTRLLTKQGYRVRPAINGQLALRSARKFPPDLILLDIVMPGLDGFEVCRQLKADEYTQDIPIIFISSHTEINEKVKAFAAGGIDYITKPFQEKEIVARIQTHLTLRAAQKQIEAKNEQLEYEIATRRQAEQELENYRTHLEELVTKRTADLEETNAQLRQEIFERRQAERALRQSEASYRNLAQENTVLLEQARHDAQTKTVLLNEVNHRVKNNLSAIIGLLLTEQRYAHTETVYRARLKGLIGRIQGLAKVHSMLSANEWQPLPLHQLVQHITSATLQLVQYYHRTFVDIAPSSVEVTPAQAGSLALIINELVTNSLKHALPRHNPTDDGLKISVSIDVTPVADTDTPALIKLQFSDNGPGYPENVLHQKPQVYRLGLYLINNLVTRDLNGQFNLTNHAGAVATLNFPQRVVKITPPPPAD